MFSRLSVKRGQFEELAKVTECDTVTFQPLNEMKWLSRHFAVSTVMWNYSVLMDCFTDQVNKCSDPIKNCCLNMLMKLKI
jgi:hypothetical protein